MTGPQIAMAAREQIAMLTGYEVDGVSSLQRSDEGWKIMFELVEMKRIPESSDVLATYETVVDEEGTLLHYQRTRRYQRHQIMEA